MNTLEIDILGNSLRDWLLALLVFIAVLAFFRLVRYATIRYFVRLGQRTGARVDELLTTLVNRTHMLFAASVGVFCSSLMLDLPPSITFFSRQMVTVALILQFIWWGLGAIDYWVQRRIQAEQDQGSSKTTLNAVRIVLQVTLWSIGILLILQNVTGLDMNALLAALGVGGIAVALAVQNILGDLFSSISISLDKPFVIGDNIAIDNYIGTVEYIGLKSTRLRSISGEELIISNSDLLSSRIRNFERQERRRVVGTARVSYNTGSDKLERIPDLIKAIITTQDQVIFDRAHLKEFGDFGFVFEYVYFLESADIHLFMDRQQVINLAITRILEDQGVQFAALVQPPENPKVQ